jgi:hypothetical protein
LLCCFAWQSHAAHGFDEHPEARYPIFVNHGHYPGDLILQTEPPAPDLDPDSRGYLRAREGYDFYQKWTQQSDYPRHLILQIQHPTPYYDDSYAVNSASMGPWGDAIMQELLPAVERQFRGIGEGWARCVRTKRPLCHTVCARALWNTMVICQDRFRIHIDIDMRKAVGPN